MVLRSEQNTSLLKSKGLQDLYSDFQSDNWWGQTLCDKMDGTLFLGRRKYLLSGPKNDRPIQARPYTGDFERNNVF